MATKDWKKHTNEKRRIIFLNDKYRIKIEIIKLPKIHPYYYKRKWIILINSDIKALTNTKSQALKFARAYMRKH